MTSKFASKSASDTIRKESDPSLAANPRKGALRIAIVGCGSIGRRHLANLRQLTAACPAEIFVHDVSTTASKVAASEFGAVAVQHQHELWNMHPNVALICTPSHLHTPCALTAAWAGAALFIEKPVSHTLDALEELEALTSERRLPTLVGCNMRFHPGPAQIKRWLMEGVIGDVLSARLHTGSYLPAWRPHQDYRVSYSASTQHGGAVLDCIHEIDLALWLLGPARLHSALVRPATTLGLQTDGLAELLLEHSSGALSSIHLNFVQRNYERKLEIVGSVGTLTWDFQAGKATHYGSNGTVVQCSTQPDDWQINQMYSDEMSYFLCCLPDREPTFNSVGNAARTLDIALQVRRQGALLCPPTR